MSVIFLALALVAPMGAGRTQAPGERAKSPAAEQAFADGDYADAYRLIMVAVDACEAPARPPDFCLSLLQQAPNIAVAADRPADAERLARRAFALAQRLGASARPDQVLALVSLGGALVSQGRVREAEASYRQALPIAGGFGADSPFVAIIENSLSLALDAQGKFVEAEPLRRRGLAGISKMPGTAAAIPTLTVGLGDNLAGQGRLAEADAQYRQALDLARQVHGAAHPVVAQILSSVAVNAQRRGRFVEAERLFRDAATMNIAKLGPDHPLAGRDVSNLGSLYLDWGKLSDAERQFRQALAISERTGGPNHPAVASDLGNLGVALRLEGRASEAESSIRRALEIDSAQFGPDSPRIAGHYGNIAANLEDQGRFADAEALRRRVLAIQRGSEGADNADAGGVALGLAGNLLAQGKFAEAESLLLKAIRTLRSGLGKGHPSVALAYGQLGVLFARTGRDVPARRAFERALKIDLTVLGGEAPRTASDYHNLAAILERAGDYAGAEAAGRRALAIRSTILASSHPDIANSKRLLSEIVARDGARRSEALALMREAMAIARGRRARSFSGEAAAADMAAVTSARIRAQSFDIAAFDPLARSFASFIQLASARAEDTGAESAALRDEAFVAAQDLDVSMAALTMAQTASRTAAGNGLLAGRVRRQQDLADRSRLLDRRLIEALAAGESEKATALRVEAEQADRDLAEVDAELARVFPSYSSLIAPRALSVPDVQRRLRPNEALLLIKPIGDDVILFAVTGGRVAWHKIEGGNARIEADVEQLRCQMDQAGCATPVAPGIAQPARFDPARARQLHDSLIAPLGDALAGVDALYVTTSGPLANLPLDMLVDPDGNWLSDHYAITVLPAVSVLKLASGDAGAEPDVPFVGYGDPDFGARAIADFLAIPSATLGRDAASDRSIFSALAPLPGTRMELNAMASALGAAGNAVILGDRATEGAIRNDPRLPKARVIAFATHGFLPNEIGGRSEPGLVFTPPGAATSGDDGILQASEASTLVVAADWLVLSACNTASGKGGADSLSALSRAFLFAGAKAVLASHWRVSDEATAALTVAIVATATADPDVGKARARQHAMKAIRTGRRSDGSAVPGWNIDWAHPTAWAPFVLIASDAH